MWGVELEMWSGDLDGPCIELSRDVEFTVDVVQIIVTDDAVHICRVCFLSAPFEVEDCSIVDASSIAK